MLVPNQIQKPRQVLVVDDQEMNRDLLGMILEDYYDVIFACDGDEALDLIRKNAATLSIVMLDIFMPRMNGFEVLKQMKEDPETKDIPVIVLTAEKSAELEALQLGAADFITKPFDLHEVILARVGRIVELCEGKQLILSAEHDKISLLYSQNFFFEYAERLFAYHKEVHFDAVVLNIEQFHSINALHGREYGDRILSIIGEEIAAFLSESEGIGGRFEGDRFAIYCIHQDDYRALLSRLQNRVNGISSQVNILLRMGVKEWDEGVEPILMFDQARAACNMARGDYTDPFRTYDEGMLKKELLDQRLLNDLRRAIETRQFEVFYQPKYDIQCEPPRLKSAEALIRWRHPDLGMISPGVFIPLFEGKGLIGEIDEYVMKETADQIVRWREKYGITFPVSVNLSRADVFDATLVDRLTDLIKQHTLSFHDIKLEVTESAYTEHAKQVLDIVNRLREIGFEIEMDDFGSGYSSLNMLSSMPIDVLKMDMKFVRGIEQNKTDELLVKLILDIAKNLHVPVVAEGVETEGQLHILKDAGCDLVQGYYFSRPLPAGEFEKLIEKELATERN